MKIKSLLFAIFLGATLFSCNDAIEIAPKDEITDSNAITSTDDLIRAMTGVYGSVGGSSFIEWNSYFTDEVRKGLGNRGAGVQVHTWSINSGTEQPDAYYAGLYTTISRVNAVLAKFDNVPVRNQLDQDIKDRSYAELLTIRAMCHFDLMRFFATSYTDDTALATPIVDHAIVFETLPRNTVGEVMAFVNADLATAYTLLSSTPEDPRFSDETNFPRFKMTIVRPVAIQALRARIALYRKDYDAAITYADEVIAAIPLAASAGEYVGIWSDANDVESIWKLKRVNGNGQVGRLFKDFNGDVFYNVSTDLFNQFQANDVRRSIGALIESGSTLSNLKVGKYPGTSADYGRSDIKLFRVAEMYLIRAEAEALKASPDLTEAANSLNLLRAKRRLTPTALPNLSFITQTDAFNAIMLERRKELAFEGHRFFDLKRWGLGVDRIPADVVLNTFAEDLPAGDYRFTLPIPSAAIRANRTLIQNTGYTNN